MEGRVFRTEMSIPVRRDSMSFSERQRSLFDDMSVDFNRQRRDWEQEMDQMRNNFFSLKPFDDGLMRRAASPAVGEDSMFTTDREGRKFRVRFDVAGFNPEEIKVNTEENKITVYALHKEQRGTSTVSNEFRRQVDIPSNVNPDHIHCLLSTDGVLTLEAPLQAPTYQALQHSTGGSFNQHRGSPTEHIQSSVASQMSSAPVNTQHSYTRETHHANGSSPIATTHTYSSSPRFSSPLGPSLGRAGPVIVEEGGIRKMRITVPSFEFKPEELHIKTHGKRLHIEAKHEERTTSGSCTKQRMVQFSRDYDLPEYVNPNDVSAFIEANNTLVVEAPVKAECQSPRPAIRVKVTHQ